MKPEQKYVTAPLLSHVPAELDEELDLSRAGERVELLERHLQDGLIGQNRAVKALVDLYGTVWSGLAPVDRPKGIYLFLGPSGSGKTRSVELVAGALFDNEEMMLKINCGEFQHSHEIAKLIGSPPGYLGHRETEPMLSQSNVNLGITQENPFRLILFDEIEKASDALWNLMLGILDKGVVNLGTNAIVDMRRTIIFMTSNLGSREMAEQINGSIGFAKSRVGTFTELDQKIYRIAMESAKRNFSPEFMNRVDKVVVFRSLDEASLRCILQLELSRAKKRIDAVILFFLETTPAADELMMQEGLDRRYGARHIKRAIERFLMKPISGLINSGQVNVGDHIVADIGENGKLKMIRKAPLTIVGPAKT